MVLKEGLCSILPSPGHSNPLSPIINPYPKLKEDLTPTVNVQSTYSLPIPYMGWIYITSMTCRSHRSTKMYITKTLYPFMPTCTKMYIGIFPSFSQYPHVIEPKSYTHICKPLVLRIDIECGNI